MGDWSENLEYEQREYYGRLYEPDREEETEEENCDYERAVDQLEHDILYEPTFNQDDGSM